MQYHNLNEIQAFLGVPTPDAWVQTALSHRDILLIDHANCEKKAASSGLSLLFRYPEFPEIMHQMSRLEREELRHFEQVLVHLKNNQIQYRHLEPSRYVKSWLKYIRTSEPDRLVDLLILGAFIEARSCERFSVLVPHLEGELQKFYQGLLSSEARHFTIYLDLAEKIANTPITSRVELFAKHEAELITSVDDRFRFHSGVIE